jgi:type VI secretion system secreted protein Hcp
MAQTNIYLKLDSVDGESIDKDHDKWIEVESFTWGVDNPSSFATGQGGQATQAHVATIGVQKRFDNSSVTLFKNCTTGKHIQSGTISCMKLDGDTRVEYLKIELTDIMVSNIQYSGVGADQQVQEHASLVFAKFKKTYQLQQNVGSAQGAKEFGYDIQKSVAS